MPKRAFKIRFLLFALLLPVAVRAAEPFTGQTLRRDVEFLASEACQGRGSGSAGLTEAGFYILRSLRDAGLDPFVQSFEAEGHLARNLIAALRGNPDSDRYVLVCAYYDGLGILGGKRYPGADANASGVAAMLAIAAALAADPPRENYLFVALDAHSAGLAGADQLYGKWRFSLVVNLDTLGSGLAPVSSYWPDYLIALGASSYHIELQRANRETDLRLYYDYYGSRDFTDFFYRRISDQRIFVSHGIPAVMFTSGITDHTNKESDLPETLDYPLFCRRVQLISRWLRQR